MMESLTADLKAKATEIIDDVEALGGMASAVASGMPKNRIEEAAARQVTALAIGDTLLFAAILPHTAMFLLQLPLCQYGLLCAGVMMNRRKQARIDSVNEVVVGEKERRSRVGAGGGRRGIATAL